MSKVVVLGGSHDQIRPGLGRPAIKRPTAGSVRGRLLPTGLRLPNSSAKSFTFKHFTWKLIYIDLDGFIRVQHTCHLKHATEKLG